MKRNILAILFILIIIISGGYLYLRYAVLKPKNIKPDESKATSILDLRPALIAKLQQLVKDGSDGLYNLNIEQLEPDVVGEKIDITNAVLAPDSTVLARLDKNQKAPDDVFKITLRKLHIDGIGLQDILSSKSINLESVIINEPVIEIYHKERPYNKQDKKSGDSLTLYQKLTRQLNSISINKIFVFKGNFINHNLLQKDKVTKYHNISVNITDLLIDSSTQFDKSRFLFAKEADISVQKYLLRTPDSLYFFKCGSVDISATKHALTAKDIELIPRVNKQQFQKRVKNRQDRYMIKVPKLVLSSIDWWTTINDNKLIARQADIYDCSFSDYLDRTGAAKKLNPGNYPHQAIMQIKMTMAVEKIFLHNMKVAYEEFNPNSQKSGTIYFDNINGQLTNLTNIPSLIKKNNFLTLRVKTLFMHKVPTEITFNFNLAKVKTGDFTADVHTGAMDNTLINPVAEPIGLFSLKSGKVKEATAHIYGDNISTHGDFTMLYDSLYIIPLGKGNDKTDDFKKKNFTAFLANFLLIKNSNPDKKGNVRKYEYVVQREQHPNYFNQLWKTLLFGVIKTIGAPEKMAK